MRYNSDMRLATALLLLLLLPAARGARADAVPGDAETLLQGLGPGDSPLKARLFTDAFHYYVIKAFLARDPNACAPARSFAHTGEIDFADGELACRRRYYALLVPFAFRSGDRDARRICLEGMRNNQIAVDPRAVERICVLIADSYAKPVDEVCSGELGLALSAKACRQRLGERHGDRAACARVDGMGGTSQRRELCDGMADYEDALRAGDAERCGASEVCRLYMGQGAALLASYRTRLLAAASGTGPAEPARVSTAPAPAAFYAEPDDVGAPDRTPLPKTIDAALELLDYTNSNEPHAPPPSDSPDRVELGRRLFFDKRLSLRRDLSCASCHVPDKGWSDGLPRARGAGGKELPRRSLSLLKIGYYGSFMWDGRAKTLEDQALIPLQSPDEMGMRDLSEIERRLSKIPGYADLFAKAYGDPRITPERAIAALTAFVRRIAAAQGESRFERFRRDRTGLAENEKRGFLLFMGKGRCVACHIGSKLTYESFENSGVRDAAGLQDLGRYSVVPVGVAKGAFRTPTLFDAADTPPYMHNGSLATLRDVVEFYNRGGDDKSNLSNQIRPLGLSPAEIDDLVAFLGALSRPAEKIAVPDPLPEAP